MSRRTERVSELLRGEIARVLRQEAQDPRLRLVTLTRVDVAPDFSQALVFWSVLADDEQRIEEVEDALDAAAPFVRSRAARTLSLKRMPEFRFRHDPSLARGSETLALLQEISDESKA